MVYGTIEDDICYEVYPILLVSENCDIIIPQAISPNNDGLNDVFQIQNLYDLHLNHSLKIYNRHGICVLKEIATVNGMEHQKRVIFTCWNLFLCTNT